MIVLELTAEQRSAVEAPFAECVAIMGATGTGKSTALAERVSRLQTIDPTADPLLFRSDRAIADYAVALLRSHEQEVTLVDDVDAQLAFAQTCSPLFELQWEEFARDQLDPEVPGLRSPERFLQSAFRLIRRLRDADIGPSLFLSRAMTGATEFYANPPNLADPVLLAATKATFHDSLDTTPQELLRQRRREIDLAKILTKLYEGYVELVRTTRRMTGRDAVIEAARWLRENAEFATRLRERHRYAFVDDAQELTGAQLQLLSALFGEQLAGVTLCGDPGSAISSLQMTQPEATFALARSKCELRERHRTPRREVERLSTPRDEADSIAQRVGEWLAQGFRPEKIAVLFRSVQNVASYEAALLDCNIPVVVAGDLNVFCDRRALDALALLWSVWDPFRHDWLLRTLASRALALSDASLAILCGEPPDPQRPLFEFDEEPAPTVRASRWNPQRDLQLGWNVLRGERDDALSADAAARIARFRRLREGWVETMRRAPFEEFARIVWREGLAREGEPGSAIALAQQIALQRLLERLGEFVLREPGATLGDVLQHAEQRIASDLESFDSAQDDMSFDGACPRASASRRAGDDRAGFVQLLNVEAARGREFDHVVVADVRPGAFPRWYSPEAFLFSLRLGMIPKENVGEARASRTAKFTYYMFRSKAPQHYFERERRAFDYALRRARKSVFVTASGTPTRGVTAPEFLQELR
ncbi:MAG: UvrD-helicase domain-containing protein [Candidatus Cybelea sp.]